MKTKTLSFALFTFVIWPLLAQNPLVGTWQVVSLKGTDTDGSKISADGSQFKETKIITPTHYMLFTQRRQGDSLVFDKSIAGIIRIQGNKYIETPLYGSQDYRQDKMNFTYQLSGDQFIQKGTITTADGKKATLDELVFRKVKTDNTYADNPAIGTWNQLSSKGVDEDGKQLWSHTNATHIRFQVITPSHWMRISLQDTQFENAMGGTYRMEGDKVYPSFDLASFPLEGLTVEITQRVEGNKLYWTGIVDSGWHGANGKITVEDVFERVDAKTARTASVK